MKCVLLVIIVVLAVSVSGVSGGRWWRGVKEGARNYWKENKDRIIRTGLTIAMTGRDLGDMDLNGNGALDTTELSQYMDKRDVEQMMSELGTNEITEDDMKRYVRDQILSDTKEEY